MNRLGTRLNRLGYGGSTSPHSLPTGWDSIGKGLRDVLPRDLDTIISSVNVSSGLEVHWTVDLVKSTIRVKVVVQTTRLDYKITKP